MVEEGAAIVCRWLVTACVLGLVLAGCASKVPVAPTSEKFVYHDDPYLQKVWMAEGFRFQDYQMFLVDEPRINVPNVHPDGLENLAWARGVLRDEILAALRAKGLFATIAMAKPIPPDAPALRLEMTIVEYEKGGGGARFFAGFSGAGQPVIRVRGRVLDGARLLFAFEARRSGESAVSRVFGGYRSDRAIQEEDIRDLAADLADYMRHNGPPR
jgi:hypothetical protein